jgi:diguanylate cyclase (GGDEF)-like protein/PAS domain S-box-containing protein
MNDSVSDPSGAPALPAASPDESSPGMRLELQGRYAGRSRYTMLEYEAVLTNASIGIAFTRDRKFFLCNPRFAEMFGWTPAELIGQTGEVIYTGSDSYEALGAIVIPRLSAGKQIDIEWEMRRRDGSTFLARIIAKTINPSAPQQGTIWIAEDITDRKRAASELNRVVREQEAIFESASMGIAFIKDRSIVRCNRRYEEMYGYEPGELAGRSTLQIYADQDEYRDAAPRAYEALRTGKVYEDVAQRRKKDGSLIWARATARAIDPANPAQGSVWVIEDITEQRRADLEIQRLLLEQQALLNNAVVGITIVRDRKVLRCNRRFEELFGLRPGEGLSSDTRDMYFTDEDFERGARSYAELDDGRVHAREQWLRRGDGSGFWCRLTGRAVEAGEPDKGYVWVFEDISERKRSDEALQRLLREQNALLDNAMIGIAFLKDRKVLRCNRRFEEIFGYGQGELLNQSTRVLYGRESEFSSGDPYYAAIWRGETHQAEWRMARKDGSEFWCHMSGRAVQAGDPAQGSVWLFEDITADKQASDRIAQLAAEQELILRNATVGISFIRNRTYQRCNPRMEQMFGYEPGELLGKDSSLIHADAAAAQAARAAFMPQLATGGAYTAEISVRRKDGSAFWCKLVGRAIDPAQPEEGAIWIYDDISVERGAREELQRSRDELERAVAERTAELQAANARLEGEINERKSAENRAQHLADHDALTGLPNRRLLEDRLTQALALSYRNRKQTAAMFIDLDRFKTINDSLGHAAGDLLLKEVAVRLVDQLRDGDTVCRVGGDEFVVVLPEIKRGADSAHVAQKIIETLSQPIVIEGRELTVTPSIGISVFPDDGRDAETLIRNADAAMYHAKGMGRSNYQFFTEQMNLAASKRLGLENELRRAVQRRDLLVYYQPITELKTGCVVMHEALLRWPHPARGVIAPADFIQLAEDTGLILRIGELVLHDACTWAARIGVDKRMPVAVNLSARQFNDPQLPEIVARVLAETGLPAGMLELEITESTVMQQTDETLVTMRRLRELGVSLAIDDFGTGYSSLAYLKRFPVDKLKIDKTFIDDVPRDADDKAIVTVIIGLAHALGLKVVAEGVETEAQMEFLQAAGCDLIQGYLSGRPTDADSAAAEYL